MSRNGYPSIPRLVPYGFHGSHLHGAVHNATPAQYNGLYYALSPADGAQLLSVPGREAEETASIPAHARTAQYQDDIQSLQREVANLRQSHEATWRLMMEMSDTIRSCSRVVSGHEHGSIFDPQHSRRALLFLSPLFAAFLKSSTASLCKPRPGSGSAFTMQVLPVSSGSTECTLLELMALAARFQSDKSVECDGAPDFHSIRFADADTVSELRINFRSYADLCQALQAPLQHRKAGLYKEKRYSTQQLQAVQVLGTVHVDETSGSKQIFLGASPSLELPTNAFYLDHTCAEWDSESGDWDRGVDLKKSSSSARPSPSPNRRLPHFSLVWRRMAKRAGCIGPDVVPGTVRGRLSVVLSAVRICGAQLLSSTSFCLALSERHESVLTYVSSTAPGSL